LSLVYHPIWLNSEVILIVASQRAGRHADTATARQHFATNHPGLTMADIRQRIRFKHERDFLPLEAQLRIAGVWTS
jgi:hypothetical protein